MLLADNSTDFPTAAGAIPEIEDSAEVVGRVGGANEIIEASGTLRPDLLLIDLGSVKFAGLTTAALVSWALPQLNIVMMGDYDSPRLRAKSRTLGARFFIFKPNFKLEFAQVLRTVSSLPNGYNARAEMREIVSDRVDKALIELAGSNCVHGQPLWRLKGGKCEKAQHRLSCCVHLEARAKRWR